MEEGVCGTGPGQVTEEDDAAAWPLPPRPHVLHPEPPVSPPPQVAGAGIGETVEIQQETLAEAGSGEPSAVPCIVQVTVVEGDKGQPVAARYSETSNTSHSPRSPAPCFSQWSSEADSVVVALAPQAKKRLSFTAAIDEEPSLSAPIDEELERHVSKPRSECSDQTQAKKRISFSAAIDDEPSISAPTDEAFERQASEPRSDISSSSQAKKRISFAEAIDGAPSSSTPVEEDTYKPQSETCTASDCSSPTAVVRKDQVAASHAAAARAGADNAAPRKRKGSKKRLTFNPMLATPDAQAMQRLLVPPVRAGMHSQRSMSWNTPVLNTVLLVSNLKSRRGQTMGLAESQRAMAISQEVAQEARRSQQLPTSSNGTPAMLRRSVLEMNVDRVKELIDAGVSVNTPHPCEDGSGYKTILHELCGLPPPNVPPSLGAGSKGIASPESLKIIESILDAMANVNPRSSDGMTPLMLACKWKNKEAASLLVEHDADVTPYDDLGYDCLLWSVVLDTSTPEGPVGTASMFAEYYSSNRDATKSENASAPSPSASKTCSRYSISSEEASMQLQSLHSVCDFAPSMSPRSHSSVGTMVSEPRNRNDSDVDREELGLISADLVRMVFEARKMDLKVDPDEARKKDKTFSWASSGFNPTHMTDTTNEREVLENWALGFAVDDTSGAVAGKAAVPPLTLAVRHANYHAAEALIERRARPHCLHDAVRTCSRAIVQMLLDAGADTLRPDKDGNSPMDLALQLGVDPGIVEALREATRHNTSRSRSAPSSSKSSRPGDSEARGDTKKSCGHKRSSVVDSANKKRMERKTSLERLLMSSVEDANNPSDARPLRKWFALKLSSAVQALSVQCSVLCHHRIFQTIMFCFLIGALFTPDLWVLMDAQEDAILDVLLIIFLVGFVFECLVQAIGLYKTYLFSFFFYMDIIGACSLLVDLSIFQTLTGKKALGDNAVIMRAARAAKMGARAGRFTRILKVLRFLPFLDSTTGEDQAEVGIAKGLSQSLIQQLSTRVSCLIIVLVMVLPLFSMFSHPEQDWSMQVWTEQLADALREGMHQAELQELTADFRAFFAERNYQPHSYCQVEGEDCIDGTVVYWRTPRRPLYHRHELPVYAGGIVVKFDFSGPSQVESGLNILMIIVTILLMAMFAMIISTAVTNLAVTPLEAVLSKVRTLGSTLYCSVENMHNSLRKDQKAVGSPYDTGADEDGTEETALLDCVVRKLAALSEITVAHSKLDECALEYIGQAQSHNLEAWSSNPARISRGSARGEERRRKADELMEERLAMSSDCPTTVWSEDFSPMSCSVGQGCSVCSTLIGCAAASGNISIQEEVLQAFCEVSAGGYLLGPRYHSWYHAVDVTHVLFMHLRKCNRYATLLPSLDEVALLVAAVCHDIGHLGVNNDFLVQTSHELAIRYNDRSPLENMSCASLFEILTKPRTAVFASLSKDEFKKVRDIAIEAILHTDNAHHVGMVKKLQMFGEVNSTVLNLARDHYWSKTGLGSDEDPSWPTSELLMLFREPSARQMLRNTFLHMADVSNPTRQFEMAKDWALCIIEEFFAQGDLERQRGLPVGPLNDREKTNFPSSQVGFIEFFVAPFAFAFVRLLPPLEELTERLVKNARRWMDEWREEVKPSVDDLARMEKRVCNLEEKWMQILQAREKAPRVERRTWSWGRSAVRAATKGSSSSTGQEASVHSERVRSSAVAPAPGDTISEKA